MERSGQVHERAPGREGRELAGELVEVLRSTALCVRTISQRVSAKLCALFGVHAGANSSAC